MSDKDIASGVIDQLLQARQDKEKQKEIIIENMTEWKDAINRICASPDGQLLAKYLLRYVQLFKVDNTTNHAKLIEDNGKKKVYLELIRPFLTSEVLNLIEHQQ